MLSFEGVEFGDWSGVILVSEDVVGLCVQALVVGGLQGWFL